MSFSPRTASIHASSLLLAVAGLVVPAMLVFGSPVDTTAREAVSVFVAVVLMTLYVAALAFTNITHAHLFHAPESGEIATLSSRVALSLLALATLIVTVTSRDGETNWLEGAQLLGAYLIIAVTAFFIAA